MVSSRAARGGVAAAYGLGPDIVCLGKYTGGGLPIGAIAMRRHLGTCFAPGHKRRLGHGGTFNGNRERLEKLVADLGQPVNGPCGTPLRELDASSEED